MMNLAPSRYALNLSIAVALLSGCGGLQPPSGAPGAMPQGASCVSPARAQGCPVQNAVGPNVVVEFAYVTNLDSNNVSAYTVNATSGALKKVKGSPFGAGSSPSGVAIDPTGKFAYVTNLDSNNVSAYTIDATSGALTPVNGSPFGAGIGPRGVAVDPTCKFAYVTNLGYGSSSPGNVSAYRINATSGALTQVKGSPFPAGATPYNVAVDPTDKFAYVINLGNAGSGSHGSVSAYSINARSGALTQVTGSPFSAGDYTDGLAVAPAGTFAYAVNMGSNNVSAYKINATNGALTQVKGSPFAAGTYPWNVAVDPTGKFAYVTNLGYESSAPGNVSAYRINAISGALTQVKGSPFGAGVSPLGVAVDPTGKFAYVTNFGSVRQDPNSVSAYTINATSGALTQVKGSPFKAGSRPYAVAACRVKAGKCIPPPL